MAIDVPTTFTIARHGYDKDQVDDYLERLSERASATEQELYDMQEQTRYLEEEHARMAARIEELESAIRKETPLTVAALGQRLTLILSEAEEGAADTIAQASARAEYLIEEARKEAEHLRRQASTYAAQANETIVVAQRQADALAERIEGDARAKASAIIGEAELRAQRRHDQIEGWAQDVIARTQADQARLAEEFAKVRRHHEVQVNSLLGQRDEALAALHSLKGSLARAIERIPAAELGERQATPAAPTFAAVERPVRNEPSPRPEPAAAATDAPASAEHRPAETPRMTEEQATTAEDSRPTEEHRMTAEHRTADEYRPTEYRAADEYRPAGEHRAAEAAPLRPVDADPAPLGHGPEAGPNAGPFAGRLRSGANPDGDAE